MEEYRCTLTEKEIKKAKSELNENPKTRMKDVAQLREMVKSHKGLKADTSDGFLLRFLRARKFNIKRAFENIEYYYGIRNEYPDVFDNLTPVGVKMVLDDQLVTMLPEPDREGRRVLVFRPGRWEPEKYEITNILRANIVCIEQILQDDESVQVHGLAFVVDMEGMTMTKAYNIGPSYVKKASAVIQEAMPMRLKGFNFVREPGVIGYIFGLFKMFMKKKILDRVQFHAYDMESLHKNIQPEILPAEYDGKQPPFDNTEFKKKLLDNQAYFEKMGEYKLEQVSNIFHQTDTEGVTGTFKKLNVD